MTTYTYQDWLSSYGKPSKAPYSEAEARRRFEAGKRVTAIVGDPSAPELVIEVDLSGEVVNVKWLDELQRPVLEYTWAVRPEAGWPSDKLLLEQVYIREYADATRLPEAKRSYNEHYHFKPDGHVVGFRAPKGQPRERMDAFKPEELQIEDIPTFGAWEPLIQRER